jgi:hypothetical protein
VELKLKVINFSTSPSPPFGMRRPLIFIRANLGDIKTIGKNYKRKRSSLVLIFTPLLPREIMKTF